MENFYSDFHLDEEALKKEKNKSRLLRQSQWWKRRRSAGLCHYCGKKFEPSALTMDHVLPLSRGGRSSKGNVVPACKECNTKKKYFLPFEWEEYLEKAQPENETEEPE